MRFFVPNPAGAKKEEQKGQPGKPEDEENKDSDSGSEKVSPAEQLYQNILKKANIGTFAGEAIVTLPEIPMITPRGKYSLDMYQTFLKFHGRTHNFKILYKHITRAFVLPKPDGQHIGFVIALSTPIKQGQTYYPFLVLQFHKDTKESVKTNISPEQLKELPEPKLEPQIEGPLHDVLSKIFLSLVKIKIVVPAGFKSSRESAAVRCSVKAFDGYLYPLEKALLFVNKPVVYIRLADIQFVEFARVSQGTTQPNRSFDLNVHIKTMEVHQFTGLDRNEYGLLLEYIQLKKITIRNVESEHAQSKVIQEQLVKFILNEQLGKIGGGRI